MINLRKKKESNSGLYKVRKRVTSRRTLYKANVSNESLAESDPDVSRNKRTQMTESALDNSCDHSGSQRSGKKQKRNHLMMVCTPTCKLPKRGRNTTLFLK